MNDLQATIEARELLGQLRAKLSSAQTVPADMSGFLVQALEQMLAFPTFTRDLVSRNEVYRHLHDAALPALRQAAGVDVQ